MDPQTSIGFFVQTHPGSEPAADKLDTMSIPAPALIVPAVKKHTATVIMMHGLGDTGAGWVTLAENFRRRRKFEEVAFVFPNAPTIPITVNGGMSMPGWYDIKSFGDLAVKEMEGGEDEAGIVRSQQYVHSLIRAEAVEKGISSNRIVLGGFSQGGSISILSGLTSPVQLGGIFALSSYLLLRGKIRDMVPTDISNKETPIFLGHGDVDPLVKYEWGKMTAEKLKEWGWNVDFRTYHNLAHSADPLEIDDLETYLAKVLPPVDG